MKMKFKAVELCRLDEETIKQIRNWRNQDFVRKMMYTQHEISEQEHLGFVENLKKDPNRGLFVYYLDEEPFGVFQYVWNREEESIRTGWYLTKEEYQDMGYGVFLRFFSLEIIYKVLKAKQVVGEVLGSNEKALLYYGKPDRIEKNGVMINGQAQDICYFFVTSEQWEEINRKEKKLVEQLVDCSHYLDNIYL